MRRVSVSELKNKLSQFLRLVKQGETIEVVERSVPIARIEAISVQGSGRDGDLQRLVRDGIVSPARKSPGRRLLRKSAQRVEGDPVQILIEERSGR